MPLFQAAATIEKISTRADDTISINCGTQELTPEQATELFKLKGKLGWLLFKENEISLTDLPESVAPEYKNEKTPAQRLRATLFVFWKSCTDMKIPFNTYYEQWIEKKINEIKSYLS